jgi:hypothetical protein
MTITEPRTSTSTRQVPRHGPTFPDPHPCTAPRRDVPKSRMSCRSATELPSRSHGVIRRASVSILSSAARPHFPPSPWALFERATPSFQIHGTDPTRRAARYGTTGHTQWVDVPGMTSNSSACPCVVMTLNPLVRYGS